MATDAEDWPVPPEIYQRFPSLRMSEAAHAAWGLDCSCNRCMVYRVATDPPPPPRPYRVPEHVARPADPSCPADEYPCGHPRTPENSIRIAKSKAGNWSSACRECNRAMSRRYKARKRAERKAASAQSG